MQQIAMSWLVYRLTHSAFILGIVGFSGQIPTFILAPFAGLIADRYNRHRLLILTQSMAMLQAIILAFLVLTHMITPWEIIALSAFLGLITAFDTPIRQSFIVHMIEKKEDLSNAIALNSAMFNAARLIGPSIAGIIIAAAGEGVCFLMNAFSYTAVILSLIRMDIPHTKRTGKHDPIIAELADGFRYAFRFTPIRITLMFLALVSLMGVPYQILMPIFAKDIFNGGPETLGFLMATAGLGALGGTLYLANRKNAMGLGKSMIWATSLFSVSLIIIACSSGLWLSSLFVFLAGFGMMIQMGSSNIILQTVVDEDKRGRVMSFYTMAFMGMAPFGSLFAGYLASKIGAQATLLIGGLICLAATFLYARALPEIREKVRPIYTQKGLIPDVAEELL
jgi:MFS family permease